ncbi:MAG: hypothetical protein EPO22_07055 [Dehalococcoidia bacterium]|nr:MAG: hypothetical protein EPO22_07055 [Dehalococcoidia bacterium]
MQLLRRISIGALTAARTWPFTLAMTVAVTMIGVLSGTTWRAHHDAIKDAVGSDLEGLLHLRLYTLITAPFYQSDPGIGWSMVLMMFVFVGALEYSVGSRRAAVTFFAADLTGTLGGIAVLALLGEAGWQYAHDAARTADSGSSVGMFACAGAFAALLPGVWRWAGLGSLMGFLLPSFAWFSFATWCEHLIGVTAAVALSAVCWRRMPVRLPFTTLLVRERGRFAQIPRRRHLT